jgi:hypothetical protein
MVKMRKPINEKGFENLYEITDKGEVISLQRTMVTPTNEYTRKEQKSFGYKDKKGYLVFDLYKTENGKKIRKNVKVHRLVAQAFIPNPLNKPQVNHIDGNKTNNCVSNLEWCTNSENQIHAIKNELKGGINHKNKNRKLTFEEVKYIKENHNSKIRGKGITTLAKQFNVSESTIVQILKEKSYKFI